MILIVFLKERNIWNALGTYQNQVTNGRFYCCLSSTHYSGNRLINVTLVLNNQDIGKQSDLSYAVVSHEKYPDPKIMKYLREIE